MHIKEHLKRGQLPIKIYGSQSVNFTPHYRPVRQNKVNGRIKRKLLETTIL